MVKNLPEMWKSQVGSLAWEDPLQEGMAIHSSILAERIPMDRGAWWATVHGVTKESDTTEQLTQTHTHHTQKLSPVTCNSLWATYTHTKLSPVTCNGPLVGISRTEEQAWHPGRPTPEPNVNLPADTPWPDSPDLPHPKPWDESLGQQPCGGWAHIVNVGRAEASPQVPSFGGKRFFDRYRLQIWKWHWFFFLPWQKEYMFIVKDFKSIEINVISSLCYQPSPPCIYKTGILLFSLIFFFFCLIYEKYFS